jgi:hypothetical protein
MNKLVALVVAGLMMGLLLSATAAPVLAGGKGHATGGHTKTSATLSVTPDVVYAGGMAYTINGSGFVANQMVQLSMVEPCSGYGASLWADSSGKFSLTRTSGQAGTYTIKAYQQNGRKYTLMASITISVAAP